MATQTTQYHVASRGAMPVASAQACTRKHASDAMNSAVRAIALFEAAKGLVILLAATGLLSLLHRDLHALAVKLVEHAHLNPAARYPQIFVTAAANLQDSRLVLLALGSAAYSALRFVEAFGLFQGRAWAEVLAAGSGAIYVPFEVLGFVRHPTLLHATFLLANVVVVLVMVSAYLQRGKRSRQSAA